MSEREQAKQIIDSLPEGKLVFVLDMLNSIKGMLIEEVEPDDWDIKMIDEARQENDGIRVSFEEMLKKDGLTYADLQD